MFRTKTGKSCFPWPDHPSSSDSEWVVSHYDHNHCRNPRKSEKLRTAERNKVWCFTGKGGAWEYCSVPKCKGQGQMPGSYGPWKDRNTTDAENQSYPAILAASILLGIVDFFLIVIIFTIIVSWAREKFWKMDAKQEENSEMKRL